MTNEQPILVATELRRDYAGPGLFGPAIRALDGVSFQLKAAEILAIVGESGSGKSTLGRLAAGLERPTSGQLRFDGRAVSGQPDRAFRRAVQVVFQDPYSSLNPAHPVRHQLERPLVLHHSSLTRAARAARVEELLVAVGLEPSLAAAFPRELSGGQRQRVAIARALAVEPRLIVADEPTSMLDMSVRVGILNLMQELRANRGIALIYITHDLASARYVADRALVLLAGREVEQGPIHDVLERPQHPYTQLLLAAAPRDSGRFARRELPVANSTPPPQALARSSTELCPFAFRCVLRSARCDEVPPPRIGTHHSAYCHALTRGPKLEREAP